MPHCGQYAGAAIKRVRIKACYPFFLSYLDYRKRPRANRCSLPEGRGQRRCRLMAGDFFPARKGACFVLAERPGSSFIKVQIIQLSTIDNAVVQPGVPAVVPCTAWLFCQEQGTYKAEVHLWITCAQKRLRTEIRRFPNCYQRLGSPLCTAGLRITLRVCDVRAGKSRSFFTQSPHAAGPFTRRCGVCGILAAIPVLLRHGRSLSSAAGLLRSPLATTVRHCVSHADCPRIRLDYLNCLKSKNKTRQRCQTAAITSLFLSVAPGWRKSNASPAASRHRKKGECSTDSGQTGSMIAIECCITELDEDECRDRFLEHARDVTGKIDRSENYVCQKRRMLTEMAKWVPLATALQWFLIDRRYVLERHQYSCDTALEPLPAAFIFCRRSAPGPEEKRYE